MAVLPLSNPSIHIYKSKAMKKAIVPILLSTALLFACDKSDDTAAKSAKLNQAFTLKINEAAKVEDIKITFLDITEDSRCPTNVDCIWAGRVVADFKAEKGGETVIKSVTDNPQANDATLSTSFEAFGHLVTLQEVTPYPAEPGDIEKSEYRAKIVVE